MSRWGNKILKDRKKAKPKKQTQPAPRYPYNGSEDDLQIFCADWLRARGLAFNHCPNERRDVEMLGKLKKKGLQKGFPDLEIFSIPPRFPNVRGVAYELKDATGKVSNEQFAWLETLSHCNWWTGVIRSPDEFLLEMRRLGWG